MYGRERGDGYERVGRATPPSTVAHPSYAGIVTSSPPSTTVLGHAGTRRGLEDSDAPASTPSLRQTQGEVARTTGQQPTGSSRRRARVLQSAVSRMPSHATPRSLARHRRAPQAAACACCRGGSVAPRLHDRVRKDREKNTEPEWFR
jgi:hypothetical protein